MKEENTIFEITCRTIQGRLLLKPSAQLNKIVLGILGRALTFYPVLLHLVVVVSNHIHLIVTAKNVALLARFMCYVNSNLAREAGRLHTWKEKFWGRRYTAIPILDNGALLKKVKYLLSHGCKEGLVMRPVEWPGVNCVKALTEDEKLSGVWYDRSAEYEARRQAKEYEQTDFESQYEVPLAPLPWFDELDSEENKERIMQIIEDIEHETHERLRKERGSVLGVKGVLIQSAHRRPRKAKKSPAPLCHCSSRQKWFEYRDEYRWFVWLYQVAAKKLRRGILDVEFPKNCFPPALAFNDPSPAPT
ncbi:MAG: transposase [Deltaproteobacteria bacterium]|nr:transposase [Deltaproteobacteria bacterium]